MKHFNSILAVTIVTSLIACGKNSPTKTGPAKSGGGNVSGTIDGGGGNSYNDKMLESYIVRPEEISGYELLRPLLSNLKSMLSYDGPTNENDNLEYFLFIQSVLEKTWYFIPSELMVITNDKIGAPFNAGTVQVAFQNFDAVWIDKNAFNKMSLEDKAQLILHEIVMGLKILKFESDSKILSAVHYPQSLPDEESIINPVRLELDIKPNDVSQVRTVTRKLWERKDQKVKNGVFEDGFNKEEYGALLVHQDFERLLYKDDKLGREIGIYELIAGYKVKNIDTFFSEINDQSIRLSADYTQKDGAPNTLVASSTCKLSIIRTGNEAEMTVHIIPNNPSGALREIYKERKLVLKVSVPEVLYYKFSNGYRIFQNSNHSIQFVGKGDTSDSIVFINLHFNGDFVAGLDTGNRAINTFTMPNSLVQNTITKGTEFGDQYICNSKIEGSIDDD